MWDELKVVIPLVAMMAVLVVMAKACEALGR